MSRFFTQDHEWVDVDGDAGTVGISDYAQSQLGDVVFVEVPEAGKQLTKGADAAVVESVKAASDVYTPVSGTVTEINGSLEGEPELVNTSADEGGELVFSMLDWPGWSADLDGKPLSVTRTDAGLLVVTLPAGASGTVDLTYRPPGLTLGLPPHCDRNLITVLLQPGYVCGLQVSYGGGWIDVEPVPGALVINFGHQLEIATNGLLRSVEHRAVANAVVARTSVAAFIMPTMDCMVEPAKELVGEGSPARYRSITFRDFMRVYKTVGARRESVEKAFRI
jgi:glycine cleavage system H protein